MTSTVTFDDILDRVISLLKKHEHLIGGLQWLVINRDLNGRARFIVPESLDQTTLEQMVTLGQNVAGLLGPHGYPSESMILTDSDRETACRGASAHPVDGWNNVWLADRLATETDWAKIRDENKGQTKRVVFFSIKGGVGRSTALAATA